MKINKFLLGAFALSMTFASCSNDEPAKGGDSGNVINGEKYIAVNIENLSNGSRATVVGSPEFEDAKGQEGVITAPNLYFFFFDDKGNAFPLSAGSVNGTVISNMVKPTSLENTNTEGDGSETKLKGILVLGKAVGEGYVGKTPKYMLCVANPTVSLGSLENKNMSTVLATPTTAPTAWTNDPTSTSTTVMKTFLMTNSVYADDKGNVINRVDVDGKFQDTPELATENPVVIHLERLVAKVRTTYASSYNVQVRKQDGTIDPNGTFNLDNEDVKFTVRVDGWGLRKLAGTAAAYKKLTPANYAAWDWTWNDPTKHRSYWAESEHGTNFRESEKYDIYSSTQFTLGSFNAAAPTENITYCYENTGYTDTEVNDRSNNTMATGIMVKATILKDGTPVDMFKWAGSYHTAADMKAHVAQAYNATNPVVLATADNVTFETNNAGNNTWHAVVTINDVPTSMADLFGDLKWWKNGVTSYYLNIKHLGNLTGVVRNHIYDYVLESVVGLGVPGNDPENPTPDEETFLAARVNVLNWHVVSNKVTLE